MKYYIHFTGGTIPLRPVRWVAVVADPWWEQMQGFLENLRLIPKRSEKNIDVKSVT